MVCRHREHAKFNGVYSVIMTTGAFHAKWRREYRVRYVCNAIYKGVSCVGKNWNRPTPREKCENRIYFLSATANNAILCIFEQIQFIYLSNTF